MPLFVQKIEPQSLSSEEINSRFQRLLQQQPAQLEQLPECIAGTDTAVIEGIFNGQPVVLAMLKQAQQGWQLDYLIVHPATRQRGVGTDMLKQLLNLYPGLTVPESLADLKAKTEQPSW